MFTRRLFIQGAAAVCGGLLAGLSGQAARAGTSSAVLLIDSHETPRFTAAAGQHHLRLAGSQLERFEALRRAFAARGPFELRVHLDDAGRVLMDTALNATGRSVRRHPGPDGALVILA